MQIEVLKEEFCICKLGELSEVNFTRDFVFVGKTDEEISLVCDTESVPLDTLSVEAGWRGMRISMELDFSLVGIIARISSILAEEKIGIFVVSTYLTDYIFIKKENLKKAIEALKAHGYEILGE